MTRRTPGRARMAGQLGAAALADLEAAGLPYGSLAAELKAGVSGRARRARLAAVKRAEAVTRWSGRRAP